ncbi:universal stress protein UspA [Halobacteriales archaeon QS_1_68_20]|nr:MAG: universal stress protein UspA [Halobacteriales archaeon QS_1_68_20]
MAKRVLVALDRSPQAWAALEYALEEHADADLTALHVVDPVEAGYEVDVGVPFSSEEWYERACEDARDLFTEAQELADEYGVDLETTMEVGRPARAVVEFSEREDVDEVVVGSHGRTGVQRIVLGSVAETVVRRSSIPVTVVR